MVAEEAVTKGVDLEVVARVALREASSVALAAYRAVSEARVIPEAMEVQGAGQAAADSRKRILADLCTACRSIDLATPPESRRSTHKSMYQGLTTDEDAVAT